MALNEVWCVVRPYRVNIGGATPPQSNTVCLRADPSRGVWAQFCFDPSCFAAGFRGSRAFTLPAELRDRMWSVYRLYAVPSFGAA